MPLGDPFPSIIHACTGTCSIDTGTVGGQPFLGTGWRRISLRDSVLGGNQRSLHGWEDGPSPTFAT